MSCRTCARGRPQAPPTGPGAPTGKHSVAPAAGVFQRTWPGCRGWDPGRWPRRPGRRTCGAGRVHAGGLQHGLGRGDGRPSSACRCRMRGGAWRPIAIGLLFLKHGGHPETVCADRGNFSASNVSVSSNYFFHPAEKSSCSAPTPGMEALVKRAAPAGRASARSRSYGERGVMSRGAAQRLLAFPAAAGAPPAGRRRSGVARRPARSWATAASTLRSIHCSAGDAPLSLLAQSRVGRTCCSMPRTCSPRCWMRPRMSESAGCAKALPSLVEERFAGPMQPTVTSAYALPGTDGHACSGSRWRRSTRIHAGNARLGGRGRGRTAPRPRRLQRAVCDPGRRPARDHAVGQGGPGPRHRAPSAEHGGLRIRSGQTKPPAATGSRSPAAGHRNASRPTDATRRQNCCRWPARLGRRG